MAKVIVENKDGGTKQGCAPFTQAIITTALHGGRSRKGLAVLCMAA